MMAARNAMANHFNDLFRSVFTSHARKRNATNKTPWAHPKIVTAIGCLKIYFNGIAMPNRTRNEIPSAIPVLRSHDNCLFIRTYYALKIKDCKLSIYSLFMLIENALAGLSLISRLSSSLLKPFDTNTGYSCLKIFVYDFTAWVCF